MTAKCDALVGTGRNFDRRVRLNRQRYHAINGYPVASGDAAMYPTIPKPLFLLASLFVIAAFEAHPFETSAAEADTTQNDLNVLPRSPEYIPPSEYDLRNLESPTSETLTNLQGESAGFLTSQARALTPFRHGPEYFFLAQALPTKIPPAKL
jgi:hypothetical protein